MNMLGTMKIGQALRGEAALAKLVDMLYERNDVGFSRGRFRVRGDTVEVHPANIDEEAIRIEFFGDEVDRITRFDPLTGHMIDQLKMITLYPAKQFVTPNDKMQRALVTSREEMQERIIFFE